jgi:hypothetical protein
VRSGCTKSANEPSAEAELTRINHCLISDQIEIEEREALLADIERQISEQELIQSLRHDRQPTRRATLTLIELHQKADRQRDYLKVLHDRESVALPTKRP